MEPVTQALLGAASAELVAGKSLPRPTALVFGALIGMSPDLDILLGPLNNGYGEWLFHRGTTHSLWFGFAIGPLLGWALWKWRDPEGATPPLRVDQAGHYRARDPPPPGWIYALWNAVLRPLFSVTASLGTASPSSIRFIQ